MSVYILSAKRTALGKFKGSLSQIPATKLGSLTIKSILKEQKDKIHPKDIGECIVGQVLTAGSGQAPARQTALGADLESSTHCLTINKVCGSGLKAVQMASDSIELNRSHLALAGGQENMSLAPHILKNSRLGMIHLGDCFLTDSLLEDGLINPFDHKHMGYLAELCVKKYCLSKGQQDHFAKQSFKKALQAQGKGAFKNEITPIFLKTKKEEIIFNQDEQVCQKDLDRIDTARAVFKKEGSITAGNASKINDGASFLLLASEKIVKEKKLKPIARILGQSVFAHDPHWFTTAPIHSIRKLLKSTGLKVEDVDLFEVNEAFSAVALAIAQEIPIPLEKLNVHGGAVALGHPIGASGARILTTLLHALKTHSKKIGLASICLGGGEACSLAVERL
ncbi:MAG: thiolase family protein [Bdellovibrionales bacterium]|nr:thiolase family protein [Bdellovibrionales bacterium]